MRQKLSDDCNTTTATTSSLISPNRSSIITGLSGSGSTAAGASRGETSGVEKTFRVFLIGRAMLRQPTTSLATLQLVLRDFYFNYRKYGSPAIFAEQHVTVNASGVHVTFRDPNLGANDRLHSVQFGPDGILQALPVKFACRIDRTKKQHLAAKPFAAAARYLFGNRATKSWSQRFNNSRRKSEQKDDQQKKQQQLVIVGRFCCIGDQRQSVAPSLMSLLSTATQSLILCDANSTSTLRNNSKSTAAESSIGIGATTPPPWFIVQPTFAFLAQLYHPPMVALVLKRQRGRIRQAIDLYLYVCSSDSDAVHLATFASRLIQMQSEQQQRLSSQVVVDHPTTNTNYFERTLTKEALLSISGYCGPVKSEKPPRPPPPVCQPLFRHGDLVEEHLFEEDGGLISLRSPFVNPNVQLSENGTLSPTRRIQNAAPKACNGHGLAGHLVPMADTTKWTCLGAVDEDRNTNGGEQRRKQINEEDEDDTAIIYEDAVTALRLLSKEDMAGGEYAEEDQIIATERW